MTGLHPETRHLLDQVRALHTDAKARREILTLDQVAAAIGRSKGRAQQLWKMAELPPLKQGRSKAAKEEKREPMSREASGAIGGRSRSPAKLESAARNIAKALVFRHTAIDLAAMTAEEMERRAAASKTPGGRLRWLRRAEKRRGLLARQERIEASRAELSRAKDSP